MSGARVAVQARDAKKLYTFEAIYFHLQKPMDPAPNNIFELCLALPILFSLSLYNRNQGGIRFYFCFFPSCLPSQGPWHAGFWPLPRRFALPSADSAGTRNVFDFVFYVSLGLDD